MSEIILTATQRETLLSLQDTSQLYNTTQAALTTGKKVNSAADNAVAYFQSQSLYYRASDLTSIKTNIDQNIQALNTAQTATSSVESLLQNLLSVVEGARTDSLSQRVSATQQFTNLATQLAQLVQDSSYQGLNILTSTNASLITQFSERTAATYTVPGFNLIDAAGGNARTLFTQATAIFDSKGNLQISALLGDASGIGGAPSTSIAGFSQLNLTASSTSVLPGSQAETIFAATETRIENAVSQIQGIAASLGTNVGILQARSDFTSQYINDLQTGGDSLTVADLNTEAANSQSLELRQQLGVQSLGVTQTLNQAILQLIK
jgi:flagellin-like hook-associated protein FlgL